MEHKEASGKGRGCEIRLIEREEIDDPVCVPHALCGASKAVGDDKDKRQVDEGWGEERKDQEIEITNWTDLL